jgi:hypothetical protein
MANRLGAYGFHAWGLLTRSRALLKVRGAHTKVRLAKDPSAGLVHSSIDWSDRFRALLPSFGRLFGRIALFDPGRCEADDKRIDRQPCNCRRQPWMRCCKSVMPDHLLYQISVA